MKVLPSIWPLVKKILYPLMGLLVLNICFGEDIDSIPTVPSPSIEDRIIPINPPVIHKSQENTKHDRNLALNNKPRSTAIDERTETDEKTGSIKPEAPFIDERIDEKKIEPSVTISENGSAEPKPPLVPSIDEKTAEPKPPLTPTFDEKSAEPKPPLTPDVNEEVATHKQPLIRDVSEDTAAHKPPLSKRVKKHGSVRVLPPPPVDYQPENAVTPASVDEAVLNVTANSVPKTESSQEEGPKRLWNLQDADILSVINEVSQETGKNFVVDPRVTGKITLVSSKPIRQSEVYQVFLSVLSILGYSAIPSGNVVKIIPNLESGENATKIARRLAPGVGDEVVVRVIPLENVSAAQLIPVLRPMLPQWSNISAYTPGNVLILMGRAANLERIYKIIQDIDKASTAQIQIIPLRHASAAQVSTVLNNLQAAARAAGEPATLSIAVDERSNSIILGGPKVARFRTHLIISQLDKPSTAAAGNTEVIYLKYLQAKTLAPLLSKIAANILGKGGANLGVEEATSTGAASSSTSNSTVNVTATGATNATTTPRVESELAAVNAQKGNILAEPSTNALIITASPALMRAIKIVIAKLDIRPAQVLVEAIIAEINQSDLLSLGIQWGSVTTDVQQPFDGTSVASFPNLGAGIIGIIPNVQLRAVLSILENTQGVDILSTPSIVVLDNQKATIEVGQEVSVQTGSYSSTNSGGSPGTIAPFTTNTYKPVTLRLDVTPQINLGSSVRLKIALKNDTLQNPENPGVTPLINTSKIANSVIIGSEDILVLGGLISNTNNQAINKVPILGDIPLIGKLLFQQRSSSISKKNLMVFIKPTILMNEDDALLISHMKYNAIRAIQANHKNDVLDIRRIHPENRMPPWLGTEDIPEPYAKNCP